MSESDSSESESPQSPKKQDIIPVNDVVGLRSKLNLVKLNLDWVEKLDVSVKTSETEVSTNTVDKSDDNKAENDFNREMGFYNQAMSAVSKAFKRLEKLHIPIKRPPDFLAEMAKSDSHMNKVREKLLSKQTAVERREQVRAIREQKKHGKKIQQEIIRGKKSEKKKMLNALKKAKKGKISADALLGKEKDSKDGGLKSQKKKKSRDFRDEKYGYGGKKRGSKWNTAESSATGNKKFDRSQNKPRRAKKPRRRR